MNDRYLWIFRIVAFFLLLILLARPTLMRPDAGLPLTWAVLIDTSLSMRVKDPVERMERAKRAALELIKKVSHTNLFEFSDELRSVDSKKLPYLQPVGKKTNLALAIKNSILNRGVRGAVLFTDGREVAGGDEHVNDAVSIAASVGRPLFLVGVGDRSLFKDIAVRNVQSPPFAFKNVPLSLSATLSVSGFPGKEIAVTLREGGKILAVQKVNVSQPEAEATVTFTWTPTTVGTKVLSVEAESYAGEATTLNNRKEVTLDVGRDRFRVLYICGEPGPEYGFLRHQFKADPAVELVTFVILRNANNVVNIPEPELSLIPFPTPDVLINQLATFDLIVFEEFSYQQYGLGPQVMYAIRQKAQDGGSFLIMGGPTVFGAGSGYTLPGVREMIPVEFGSEEVTYLSETVPFVVKAPAHPILRLEENPERNKDVWRGLPPLEGVTLLPGVKPGATVLGTVNVHGRDYPLLTVWKYGKGRVAVLATRTTWRWSMLSGEKEQLSDAYQRFWKNMVLWLTHADEFKAVRVALENKTARLDEMQTLRVWVVDDYFKPLADVDVQIQVKTPDGSHELLEPRVETNGVFAASFKPRQLGIHQIQAWVTRHGKKFGQDAITTRVVESHFEEEDLRPNFDLLKELAQITGGEFVRVDDFSPRVFKEFDRMATANSGRKVLVWDSPWLLGVALLFLAVEWTLRKRKGLP